MKKVIRSWDLAASVKSEVHTDPDATACTLMGLGVDDNIYVIDAYEMYGRSAQVTDKIHWKAEADGKNVNIALPLDPSAAGKVAFEHYSKPLIMKGYKVKKMKTRKGKLERFQGFSNAAENGMVYVVRGDWNKKWLQQLEDFDPMRKRGHDDFVDTASDGYNWLTTTKNLPNKFKFDTASLVKANRFNI